MKQPTTEEKAGRTSKRTRKPTSKTNVSHQTLAKAGATEQPFYIVGIGASAGGLEALEPFFSHMPSDSGMAFIIVQHLDPTRHSAMPDIMARLTRMPVQLAADGLKVIPNSVYLIPPNTDLGIKGGFLYLREPADTHGLRLPVDFFLRSLAKDKGPEAIAVILSGTGSDGTLGLKAIKAELGTVFVQEPQSAKYDGMPSNAIKTGLVDLVLPPDRLPRHLVDFAKRITVDGRRIAGVTEESPEPLQQVFTILRARTGHDFSGYKQTTIRRRLERRMKVNSVNTIADYARFLRDNEPEARALLKDILISVTNFFRDPEAFEALKEKLCLLANGKTIGSDLRVWVAGCATGEEAYSVAMLITECLDEVEKSIQVQIYATDIDIEALGVARTGIYPSNIVADVSPGRLKRFFLRKEDSYQVRKEIRESVVFAPHDLIKDPPFSRMDLICCRNLLIYLETDLQRKLLPLLHYALRPGGLLFLGTSETVGESSDLFSALNRKWKVYRRKETAVLPERLRFPSSFAPSRVKPAGEPLIGVAAKVPALSEKVFLDNYAPTFAVIDEKHRLVYVRGRTGKFLEIASGQPSFSIVEMAREGLRSDLASAIFEATSKKKTVIRTGTRVRYNGGFQLVNLTVAPLADQGMPPGLLMVVFQEVGVPAAAGETQPTVQRRHTALVEEELKLTKAHLQKTVEELETANEELKSNNEELQSTNEELQSANEELDTSREELQSVNEELATVNAELSSKNELLATANDDLKNYLNRTDIAIIFLDEGLTIRSYTPATSDVFNIRDIDIGRPLEEITSRLAYDNIVSDARGVLKKQKSEEIEVQRKEGHWYLMRILPYLTSKNNIGGLVVSFLDIDKQKKAVANLTAANEELTNTLKELKGSKEAGRIKDDFIGMVSHELKTPLTVFLGAVKTAMTEGISSEEIMELLGEAEKSAESMAHLVENLIDLSRFQANRMKLNWDMVDIAGVVADVITKERAHLEGHKIVVDMPKSPPLVEADQVKLEHVIRNLLDNAAKYSPKGSEIGLSVKIDKDELTVGISDHGKGISPEDQARLFQSFERLAETATTRPGLGLGLLVSKRMIESQGGKIWVESEPGKGSTFWFTLPLDRHSP